MIFQLLYHPAVQRQDIPRLPAVWRKKIKMVIEDRLCHDPELYGVPLRISLAGYRKLRVGDYRIVYRIEKQTVKIFAIRQRKDVYDKIERRDRG